MPKGDKKKKNGAKDAVKAKTEIVFKIDGTVYGQCTQVLGGTNFRIFCFDGKDRMCHIRSSIKKRQKVEVDSIVLVGLRDFQDEKGDIIFVYTSEHVAELKARHEIPAKIVSATSISADNDEDDSEESEDEDTGFCFEEI